MIQATPHNFKEIFTWETENQPISGITIPKIQRDYAQGRMTGKVPRIRERFLGVLYDALVNGNKQTLDFIYGSTKEGVLLPLDGQQRLTTLFLLHYYIAKHECVDDSEYAFLRRFTYETRVSSREFCHSLIDFMPDFSKDDLRNQIMDEAWFLLEWESDPTVCSMLVMLDSIHDLFKDTENLWEKITGDAITFYFLPINDLGLTDELYIKMNSRGKELTQFEHWKAELELALKDVCSEASKRIASKIDREWTDLLWPYRNSHTENAEYDAVTDDEFLHYAHFISDIISYRNGYSEIDKDFDIIEQQFSKNAPDALQNIQCFETLFDLWCNVAKVKPISSFFGDYVSQAHEAGKIIVKEVDLFADCCRNSGIKENKRRKFPFNRFLLLYAFVLYIQSDGRISESNFRRRLRILNNLINNSNDTLRGDFIKGLMSETEEIILEGKVEVKDEGKDHFSNNQIKEERAKLEWTEQNPDKAEMLFNLEDHPLLNGCIGVIGIENVIELNERFLNLFRMDEEGSYACDLYNIARTLLSVGDYGQKENWWRYQLGSPEVPRIWREMFAPTHEAEREKTKQVLVELLRKEESFDRKKLKAISDDYVRSETAFTWRYYVVKYRDARAGSKYGKYFWRNENPYSLIMMTTEISTSGYNYDIFLNTIYHKAGGEKVGLELGNYSYYNYNTLGADRLYMLAKSLYLTVEPDCYKVFDYSDAENHVLVETVSIPQINGVDTVDRVQIGIKTVNRYLENKPLKIVSYNVDDCQQWKIDRLLSMNADILVVPEITCPEQAKYPNDFEFEWKGISWWYNEMKWKGLGVLWRKGRGCIPSWYNPNLWYAIPVIVDGVLILGIWPTKREGHTDGMTYPQIARTILEAYSQHLTEQRTVIIGDFNCYVNQWDKTEQYGDILAIDKYLADMGFHSAYHRKYGEKLGQESKATLFYRYNANAPFFIDYAYTNFDEKDYNLFDWDSEMSDHAWQEIIV